MTTYINKVIKIALDECGYVEKSSNNQLYDKTANAGNNNYTKYWQDIYPQYQGQPWCDCFVSWVFNKVFGTTGANNMLCGGLYSFYTPTSAELFMWAGQWGNKPVLGAQVFFKNSVRINHTGIVVGIGENIIYTVEGNTSTEPGVIANGGGVCQKSYSIDNDRIVGYGYPQYGEEKMGQIYTTPTKFISASRQVYLMAKNSGWHYGDSHALPPCADGYISCDRLVARACWDLGWTDQPRGGITVLNMESYLLKWGWKKISDSSSLKAGDVVLMKENGTTNPTAAWHSFVLTAYDAQTGICSKYDEGSNDRIYMTQPFTNVPLNEWVGRRSFYCGFRCPQKKRFSTYEVKVSAWTEGAKNNSVKLARTILRAEGYNGANGKLLGISQEAGPNSTRAIRKFKINEGLTTKTDFADISKVCGLGTWKKLLRLTVKSEEGSKSKYTFRVQGWGEGSNNNSVLLAQKLFKGLGIKGKDGKVLKLDGNAGINTIYALKQFIKKYPNYLNQNSNECGIKTWRKLLGLEIKKVG